MKKAYWLMCMLAWIGLLTGCGSQPEAPLPETVVQETPVQETVPEVTVVPALPQTSEEREIKLQMGQEYQYDLDGDGAAETILCSYAQTEDSVQTLSVLINGMECYTYNIRSWDAIQDHYYLVDLYTNDTYQELAILDAGPSDDPVSVFFCYHDTILEECGAVAGFVGSAQLQLHGDSTLTGIKRLQVLQTWWGWTTWVLNENHALEELPQSWYIPTENSNVAICLLQDLRVFTQMDEAAETVLFPTGTAFTITGTDNEKWVCVEHETGTYWILLSDHWQIDTGSGAVWPDEIISGLLWAD